MVALLALAGFIAGCPVSAGSGDFGVTTGGQQDIAAARRAIQAGDIPDPDSITVEGFMSEHAIPIDPPDTADLIYAVATTAWNDDFNAFTPLASLVIGLGTTVSRENLARPRLNLCIVLDRSGSMGDVIDARTGTTKLDAVKISIDRLLARLNADDRVSVVLFNEGTERVVDGVAGNDLAAIKGAIDLVDAEGGTNLARGLRRGFSTIQRHQSSTHSDRVILFTDAELRYRAEQWARDFLDAMAEFADDDIGTTVFGVGFNFGHEIAYDISQIRGGNYFFLSDYDRIVSVFDEEFDYLVTPIAYDVKLDIGVPFEFDVTGVYGLPAEEPFPHQLELEIPTLFLSSREGGGAILVRIRPGALVDLTAGNALAEIDMTYRTTQGEVKTVPHITATLPPGLDPDVGERFFETAGTRRAVLLLNTALMLHASCEDAFSSYGYRYRPPNRELAIERLQGFLPYFDELSEGLEDQPSPTSRSLSQERALLSQLLTNIEDR